MHLLAVEKIVEHVKAYCNNKTDAYFKIETSQENIMQAFGETIKQKEQLETKVAELQLDADRYRFLRKKVFYNKDGCYFFGG